MLIECGIDRVLTSGGCVYPHIIEGSRIIGDLYGKYGSKIQMLPGGGVRVENIQDVLHLSKTHQIHMSSKKTAEGGYQTLDEPQLIELLEKICMYKE